jgi:hypothetical protein
MNAVIMNQIAELQATISRTTADMMIFSTIAVICFVIFGICVLFFLLGDRERSLYSTEELAMLIGMGALVFGVIFLACALYTKFIDLPILETQLEQLKVMAETSV